MRRNSFMVGGILRYEDLTINGNEKNSRDFTYIKDVIQANLLVAKQDIAGEIFNIGAGLPINLTNLTKLLLKLTFKEHLKINYTVPRPGDILHSYADISKANRLLKFEPKYNQEKGLEEYLKWYDQKYGTNLTSN